VIEFAKQYLNAGLSVLPAKRADKRPAVGSWKAYQNRRPTLTEVDAWFSNAQDGLCIIAGAVSGHLEMIDFDNGGELFDAWHQQIPADLFNRLVIEQSPSGGWHVVYRCQSPVDGSMKLAERKTNGKVKTLIETRGEGGLFLCVPTAGYELMQGEFTAVPVLSDAQRQVLLDAAYALNEYVPAPAPLPVPSSGSDSSSLRPGDDYNVRGDVEGLLRSHGWNYVGADDTNQKWRRPGKSIGHSATLHRTDRVFFPFSTNCVPFEARKGYSPFHVYALLEHSNDYSKAAADLARQGYGQKTQPVGMEDVDISGIVGGDDTDDDETFISKIRWNGLRIKTLAEMEASFQGLNKPIIHGLLREGETMNIIAAPKVGKSWLVNSLSISIASGLDWLGFKVDSGRVLLIDNELHENTTTYRYKEVSRAMAFETRFYNKNLTNISLRGHLQDLHALKTLFAEFRPGLFKVIIIDAFYRILPDGTDENDNGAIAKLYNSLDIYAAQLKCAFILIHHTSKGNQANKSVTDVGAGAGAQSRAVDTHLTLRAHEDDDTVVMDAATRSWPPLKSMVLRKQHPLFEVDPNADPKALQGAEKKREPQKQFTLEEFVETCVAKNDPCILGSVVYEADQLYGLSEYKTKEMLEAAQERELILRMKIGSKMKYIKNREGFGNEKGQRTAALLIHNPTMDVQEIADQVGVSRQYVYQLRQQISCQQTVNCEKVT
jgi:RecA-family ATPase